MTSNITKAYDSIAVFKNAGHHQDTLISTNTNLFIGVNFKKHRIRETQSYVEDQSNWVFLSGTLLYKDLIGGQALPELFRQFKSEKDIDRIRSLVFGNYAVAICVNQEVFFFCDEWGSRPLYYSFDDNNSNKSFVVSTSLRAAELAHANPKSATPEIAAFGLAYTGSFGLTPFENIRCLMGDQYLYYNLRKDAGFEVRQTVNSYFGEKEDYIDDIDGTRGTLSKLYFEKCRETFAMIGKHAPHGIFLTGGRDSRAVLAGLLSVGINPYYLFSFQSLSELADANPLDLEVVTRINKLIKSSHYILNHADIQPYTNLQISSLFDKWGYEISSAYNSNLGLDQEHRFNIEPYPRLMLGGFSTFFTHARYEKDEKKRYSFDDIAKRFRQMRKDYFYTSGSAVSEAAKAFIKRVLGFDCTEMSQEEYIKVMRILISTGNITEMNRYGYYIGPFQTARLANPFLYLPPEMASHDTLQLSIISELAPELLDIPFYSGHKWYRTDRNRLQLVSCDQNLMGKTRSIAAQVPLARNIYRLTKAIVKDRLADKSTAHVDEQTTDSMPLVSTQSFRIRESIRKGWDELPHEITRFYSQKDIQDGYLPQVNGLFLRLKCFVD